MSVADAEYEVLTEELRQAEHQKVRLDMFNQYELTPVDADPKGRTLYQFLFLGPHKQQAAVPPHGPDLVDLRRAAQTRLDLLYGLLEDWNQQHGTEDGAKAAAQAAEEVGE